MAIENCVTFLPCSDIKKTTHFYRDIVGLPVVQEQAGGMLKIFDTGYGYWGFCQYGDGRPIPSGDVGVSSNDLTLPTRASVLVLEGPRVS